MANHPLNSKPGRVSATVGISGKLDNRFDDVTAIGRKRPALMWPVIGGMPSMYNWVSPVLASVAARLFEEYGTWVSCTPALVARSTPVRCGMLRWLDVP